MIRTGPPDDQQTTVLNILAEYFSHEVEMEFEMGVEMEIEMEVEMKVEMDVPILPSAYTGALCAPV